MRNSSGILSAPSPGKAGGFFLALLFAASWTAPVFAVEPARPVSYYIDAALSGNPSLDAMRERIRSKEDAAIRAGALDDPKLRLGINSLPVGSWSFREEEMTTKEIGLSQMFPWPGMRSTRTDIALREKEEAGFLLEEERNRLRADIKMTYAELASVRRQAEVVRRSQAILKEIVTVTQESYSVGRGSQSDVLRGQVEFGRMREMLIGLEDRERVLSVRLNTLASLSPDSPVPPLDELPEIALPYGRKELEAMYISGRAARKAAEARIRKGGASVRMSKFAAKPEFEVSVSYMQRDAMPDGTSRDDMVSSMVQMTLPIWRKGKVEPAIREMESERRMSERELANLDLETSNLVARSLSILESRRQAAVLYRTTLIPQAEQTFQVTAESYRVGRVDFPMLMDAVMSVLSFRREYAAMVGDMHMERARLEAAIGGELDEAGPGPGGNAQPQTKDSSGEGR